MDATKSTERRSTQQQQIPTPIPLSPLTEWPEYHKTTSSGYHQPLEVKRKSRRYRKLLRLGKSSKYHRDSDDDEGEMYENSNHRRRDLMLGVLGCPLAPVSVDHQNWRTTDFQFNIKHIPLVYTYFLYMS